jgi:hypothetical protein
MSVKATGFGALAKDAEARRGRKEELGDDRVRRAGLPEWAVRLENGGGNAKNS